ncbi:MAG: small subunit ribosomal protein [Petroclostridium sp.]|uniref:30S ribosomal protein S20 n=1 Tax=Petroclostridium xylanilyticum TaxID=1792311 RepID=UPI000B983537|nr:30S ribosomal protein S20 [Petroclostridium xylanilyticum]MBZ4644692.1 ribosomal protein [Clostridia bacterium]MDK2811257.1 small subunit ribosomal protein [Petroclostridium sp.]
MPNIKSAMKRVKVIKVKTLRNQMIKSALKTYIKKFENSVVEGDIEKANAAFKMAVKKIDQAVAKGTLHKNTAARKKSQLSRKLKSLSA